MITLRKATLNDLEILQFWDTQEHVVASDPDDNWNWKEELLRDPSWRLQCIAELNGRPIGMVQIIDPAKEDTHYWGNIGPGKRAVDIWIGDANNLGLGYGTEIMRQTLNICFEDQEVHEVLIDPLETNTKAINFYKKQGFVFLERRKFDNHWCHVLYLERGSWENRTTT